MAKFAAYDPQTARTIAKFVSEQLRQAPSPRRQDTPVHRESRVIRWAKATTSPDYPTYPIRGTVFVAQLGDYALPSTATLEPDAFPYRTFTEYGTSDSDYVLVLCDGTPLPVEGSIVRIELHEGQWIYANDEGIRIAYAYDSSVIYENSSCLAPNSKAGLKFKDITLMSNDYQNDADTGEQVRFSSDYLETLQGTQTNYDDAAIMLNQPLAWMLFLSLQLTQDGDWFGGATPYIQTYTTSSDGTPAHTHTVDARSTSDFAASVTCDLYTRKQSGGSWNLVAGHDCGIQWANTTYPPPVLMGGMMWFVQYHNSPIPTTADPLHIRFQLSMSRLDGGTYPVNDAGALINGAQLTLIKLGRTWLTDWH